MFKTIDECIVKLISHSVVVDRPELNDFMPCLAARVSYANDSKTGESKAADLKLMMYLAENEHLSPFEYQHAVLMIECPLFVRSQIMRHRTFSYNEISRRYTSQEIGFWIPSELRKQDEKNKQGSSGVVAISSDRALDEYKNDCLKSLEKYYRMLADGVAREQARAVLPQSLLTRFYMGGVLRNWAHFLKLRLDEHAQKETRVIAEKISSILRSIWPNTMSVLMMTGGKS